MLTFKEHYWRSEVGDLNGWQKRLEIGLDDLIDKLIFIDSKEDGYRAHLSQLEQGLRSMKERNQLDGAPYSSGSIEKLASSVSEEKEPRNSGRRISMSCQLLHKKRCSKNCF